MKRKNKIKKKERGERKNETATSNLLSLRMAASSWRTPTTIACVGDACLTSIYRRRDDNDYFVGLRLRYRVIAFYWRPMSKSTK